MLSDMIVSGSAFVAVVAFPVAFETELGSNGVPAVVSPQPHLHYHDRSAAGHPPYPYSLRPSLDRGSLHRLTGRDQVIHNIGGAFVALVLSSTSQQVLTRAGFGR